MLFSGHLSQDSVFVKTAWRDLAVFGVVGGGCRTGVFVSKGGTALLLQLLVGSSKDPPANEELMLHIHSLLVKVGLKGTDDNRTTLVLALPNL